MFDFTKEVVINNEGMFECVEDGTRALKFRVHGGGDYFGKYIMDNKMYFTQARPGRRAVLAIAPNALIDKINNEDKHFSINIELGLDRDARGDWGASTFYFKKPMLVDVHAGSWDATEYGKNLAAMMKSILTDYKFVHVLYGAEDAAFADELGVTGYKDSAIYVVGADYHVNIRKVTINEYEGEEVKTLFSDRPAYAPTGITYKKNIVEFGTYDYLLKNLRMPTYENYRFTSPAAVEMPVAGAEYVQYTFLYCVPRPGLGGLSVAGQYNHSVTTHVFFVKSDLKAKWEEEFSKLGVEYIEVEMTDEHPDHAINILPDAFATSPDVDGDGGETEL